MVMISWIRRRTFWTNKQENFAGRDRENIQPDISVHFLYFLCYLANNNNLNKNIKWLCREEQSVCIKGRGGTTCVKRL
jgi:hypothetical protein